MSGVPSLPTPLFGMNEDSLAREFDQLFASEALSLDSLCKKLLGLLPPRVIENSNFFHQACLNKNVSLELVQCLLEAFPEAAQVAVNSDEGGYPLHLACHNENCPSSVIELLVKANPSALRQLCLVKHGLNSGLGYTVQGLPLHYYLARASNVDMDTVKLLTEAYPGSLTIGDDGSKFTPIHVLLFNANITNMNDIVQFLVETEPRSFRMTDVIDRVPLYIACDNKNIDSKTVRLLIDCWPESITQQDCDGDLPIHAFCFNTNLDESVLVTILTLLIKASPVTVQHQDSEGRLPIHLAVLQKKSPAFCKILIDAYPQSLMIGDHDGDLLIHMACRFGRVDTVKYLLELHPEDIHRSNNGMLPIHFASMSSDSDTETIKFILMKDPAGAMTATSNDSRQLPLHLACAGFFLTQNLKVVQLLFDAFPEAIGTNDGRGDAPLDIVKQRKPNSELVEFLEAQTVYLRKAKDRRAMTWLPLHHALHDNAPLGAVKLMVKGNLSALKVADDQGMLPLHIACEFSSVEVVQFLVELDGSCYLDHCDSNKNSPLHYACQGGNCAVVKLLLEMSVPSVAEPNCDKKLPIHLLCESNADHERLEYVDAFWHLLLAHPETVRHPY